MSSQEPAISVIIPVYNIAPFLEQCVESIRKQSFTNYEVIIVDDGSTDGSSEKCDQYRCLDNFQIVHTENAGAAHARNTGLDNAHGKYIAFIDGDDAIEEDYLEILYNEIEVQTVDIVSCCCKSIEAGEINCFFPDDLLFVGERKKELIYQLIEMRYGQPGPYYYTGVGVPWGKLYNRDFIERNHLRFDLQLRRLQDNMFNMYAFHCATSIKYINKPLYRYRRGHVSSLNVNYNQNLSRNSIALIKARIVAMKELGYDSDERAVKMFNGEVFKYFREVLKNIAQYYPEKKDRYALFSKVFHFKEENNIFKKYVLVAEPAPNWTLFGRKMEWWMIRHNMCRPLYMYLKVKKNIKRVD